MSTVLAPTSQRHPGRFGRIAHFAQHALERSHVIARSAEELWQCAPRDRNQRRKHVVERTTAALRASESLLAGTANLLQRSSLAVLRPPQ